MALLIKKNNIWYCGKCKMRQFSLGEVCHFCCEPFTNIEEVWFQNYNDRRGEEEQKKNE